jgi:hypothetical protein
MCPSGSHCRTRANLLSTRLKLKKVGWGDVDDDLKAEFRKLWACLDRIAGALAAIAHAQNPNFKTDREQLEEARTAGGTIDPELGRDLDIQALACLFDEELQKAPKRYRNEDEAEVSERPAEPTSGSSSIFDMDLDRPINE